ncbi:MAG: hypothetical protein ACFB51_08345 [Anaerolineae bacterium]
MAVLTEPLTVDALCEHHHVDEKHGHCVGCHAAALFRLTAHIHSLDRELAEIAYYSGLLHNVAKAAGKKGHHKRGRDILLTTPLEGFSENEQQMMALAAYFHRKKWKREKLETEISYHLLTRRLREPALLVASLVRLADGLDHSRTQASQIADYELPTTGPGIVWVAGPQAEKDARKANKKADMWSALVGLPLVVQPV